MNDNTLIQPLAMPRPTALERGLTMKDAALILGYSYTTVYRMVQAGELESYGSGKKLRVYEGSIGRYRQQTQNNIVKMPQIRDSIRATGPRYKQAMTDLDTLLSQ